MCTGLYIFNRDCSEAKHKQAPKTCLQKNSVQDPLSLAVHYKKPSREGVLHSNDQNSQDHFTVRTSSVRTSNAY